MCKGEGEIAFFELFAQILYQTDALNFVLSCFCLSLVNVDRFRRVSLKRKCVKQSILKNRKVFSGAENPKFSIIVMFGANNWLSSGTPTQSQENILGTAQWN